MYYETSNLDIDRGEEKNEGCIRIIILIFDYCLISTIFRLDVLQLLISTLFSMLQSRIIYFVKEWLIPNCISQSG